MPIQAVPVLIEIVDRDVLRVGIGCYVGSRSDWNKEFISGHDHQRVCQLRYGYPTMHNATKDEERVPILVELHQGDEDRRAENYDERIRERAIAHRLVNRLVQLRR
jgi:hypothetical protein